MSSPIATTELPLTTEAPSRIIGRIEGADEGPVIIVFAGIHGNEPAGIKALNNLFSLLEGREDYFKGKLVGISANRPALQKGVRFVDEDMNRIWFPSIIDRIRKCDPEDLESSERAEVKKLLAVLDREAPANPEKRVIFVDLHSFSAEGDMFAITAPIDRNMELLSSMHIPMIFGIEEALRGTTLTYVQEFGYISFCLEGGNHQNKLTIENDTAALALLLAQAGCLDAARIPDYEKYDRHLLQQNKHLPSSVELVYQHIIEEGDDFSMKADYTNFQPVKKGEWLANDKNGQIRAQCDGFILMPLYQQQGDDGFFIVREKG